MPSAEEFRRNVIAEFRKSAPTTSESIKIHSVPLEVIQAMIATPSEPNVIEINCAYSDEEEALEM